MVRELKRATSLVLLLGGASLLLSAVLAHAQEDKKTDEDKPADPDTGESTVEEKTLGLLPNPLQKYGVKFAATYIGEPLSRSAARIERRFAGVSHQ